MILILFINFKSTYPVTPPSYNFNSNQIATIPPTIFNYPNGTFIVINLGSNNITFLPTNAFTLSSEPRWSVIYLQNNIISSISPGSFQGINNKL